MSKRNDGHARGRYTLEFKLEAVRLVDGGQAVPVTAKILGVPVQTHGNWVRLSEKGLLKGAGDKPVSAEQIELARLRAELARVKMARDILKKATAYFARESLSSTPGSLDTRAAGLPPCPARCWVSAPAVTLNTGA